MKNIKKIIISFSLIVLFFLTIFSAGCLETSRQTQTENFVIGKVTVTEVTYLLGDDGLFTKKYVLSIQTIGSSPIIRTLTRSQYEEIKNTPAGYFLPDYLNPDSSLEIIPYITPYNKQTIISTPIPKTQVRTYPSLTQSTANIQMIGSVYGLASNPSAGINEIRFTIGLAPGAQAIDLTKMKVVFSTSTTVPILLNQGSIASTTVFTSKLNGKSNDNSMNANDQIEIAFKTASLKPNTKLNIELRPSVGAALPFSKTTPATILKTNVLY